MRWLGLFLLLAPRVAQAEDPREQLAPGLVASPHEKIGGKCDACHLVFAGVPDAHCLDCHRGITALLDDPASFHARNEAKLCIGCHTDHRGRGARMVREGIAIDHALTRWPLGGKHAGVACEKCHAVPIDRVSRECAGCHADPHQGDLGSDCARCHSDSGWGDGLKSIEDHQIDMSGGHVTVRCADCHREGRSLTAESTCGTCHPDPHGGTQSDCNACHSVRSFADATFDHSECTCTFPGAHQRAPCLSCHPGFVFKPTPTACSRCHQKDLSHEPLGECSSCHPPDSWKSRAFDHNLKASFAITGAHEKVECGRCHQKKERARIDFRATPRDCKGCHGEIGERAHGDLGACQECHATDSFARHSFDHGETRFLLTGAHVNLACKACHQGLVRSDPGADPTRCAGCHADPHGDRTDDRCQECHSTERWKPSTFDRDRHQLTAFPLDGRHRETSCARCHITSATMQPPEECAACHLDVHRGHLGSRCARCHVTAGFRGVRFDHKETGFVLRGAHATAACARCHGLRTLVTAPPPRECIRCHAEGHGDLGSDCSKCHFAGDPTFDFARGRSRFDHDDTAFPLERRHRTLPCKSCHPAGAADPVPICAVCHVDPHSGQMGRQCEDCHRADNFRLARFDHDQTSFPLRGRHFATPCARCHTNQRWIGLTGDCFDCHALDAARSNARNGIHFFGRRPCNNCHLEGWGWP